MKRISAKEKTFIVFGFLTFDVNHFEQTWVVLVDLTAPRRSDELVNVFRAATLCVVDIVPGNKGIDSNISDVNEVEPLFRQLLRN